MLLLKDKQVCAVAPAAAAALQVAYDITTSVAEAVEQMANLIRLTNFQTFTLYEATRPINFKMSAEPLPEEHMLLDENRCAEAAAAMHRHCTVIAGGGVDLSFAAGSLQSGGLVSNEGSVCYLHANTCYAVCCAAAGT